MSTDRIIQRVPFRLRKQEITMCSKKVAGVALLITGLVLVIIGVIIGLLLPNAAQKKIEESVCVNGKDSPGYERWVSV